MGRSAGQKDRPSETFPSRGGLWATFCGVAPREEPSQGVTYAGFFPALPAQERDGVPGWAQGPCPVLSLSLLPGPGKWPN